MKCYILSLTSGDLMFFASMSSLGKGDYHMIKAHSCRIANMMVSPQQTHFYTLGSSDGMLL